MMTHKRILSAAAVGGIMMAFFMTACLPITPTPPTFHIVTGSITTDTPLMQPDKEPTSTLPAPPSIETPINSAQPPVDEPKSPPRQTLDVEFTPQPLLTGEPALSPVQNETMNLFIERARQDLAQRLNVAPAEIKFLGYKEVLWPDGGLGCPKPGMVYIQIMIEGFLIQFRYGDKVYPYHGGDQGEVFLCEQEIR